MLLFSAVWQSISECLHETRAYFQILVVLFVLLSGQGMITQLLQVTYTGSSRRNNLVLARACLYV